MQACSSTVVAKRLLDPYFNHVYGDAHTHKCTNVHCSTVKKPNMSSDLAGEAWNLWKNEKCRGVVMQTGR